MGHPPSTRPTRLRNAPLPWRPSSFLALAAGLVWIALGPACKPANVGLYGGPGSGDGGTLGAPPAFCGTTPTKGLTLDAVAADYAANVHPLLMDGSTGCGACHGPASGRLFILQPDASQTFHTAYSAGLLGDQPGGILDRLQTQNTAARMPPGSTPWTAPKIAAVGKIVCELQAIGTTPGVPLDEQFPANLLQPYAGPAIIDYDNTFINYSQLKGKVKSVFADDWVRGGVDKFATNIAALGGVDFQTNFVEARVATADFLLAMDSLSKDVCSAASTNKTGPFQGLDTATAPTGGQAGAAHASIDTLYRRLLFRGASAQEQTDTYALLTDLLAFGAPPDAWSGVCEALVRHPDFLFTLPPTRASLTDVPTRQQLLLVKVAQDLVARPPSAAEFQQLGSGAKTLDQLADGYLGSTEFRDYFFYKMRIRTESDGTPDSDEPARMWTYLMVNGQPFQNLLNASYGVDTNFQKAARDPVHGATGVLTMKGFIQHKPGLPHYNYAARVLSDFMGYVFEVPADIIAKRLGATAASTVDPTSVCFTCHQLLTPLAYQRSAWADDGTFRSVDTNNQPIDDSDRGLVAVYPYKGKGLQAFSTQAVKKERFIRHTLDAEYNLLLGRPMRFDQDERVIYKQLWDLMGTSNGNLREGVKAILRTPAYQGS